MKIYLLHKTITKEEDKRYNIPKTIKTWLKDLCFPMHCPVCDKVISRQKGLICPACRKTLRMVKAPRCICCGKHLEEEGRLRCRDCAGVHRGFDRGVALFEYKSIHDSVYHFKNRGRVEYAEFYGEELRKWLLPVMREMKAEALVPIPLHPDKLRKRGYNQASILAKEISLGCGLPVREDILKRVRKNREQKSQNHVQRQNNMKKTFHIAQNDVKLKTIILVDDVFTTGNTLEAAAKELKRCGVDKVYFIALAIGKGL